MGLVINVLGVWVMTSVALAFAMFGVNARNGPCLVAALIVFFLQLALFW